MVTEIGLRERKKQQTRQTIIESASRLFAKSGFDAVTVAAVARAADVSEVTVFNYFPTKEDLVFSGLGFFEEKLFDAVRRRATGESALAAFRRVMLDGFGRLANDENAAVIAKAARLIGGSPALLTREREIVARYTKSLATLLTEELGVQPEDVEAWAVASALMGVHQALVTYVRTRVMGGKRGRTLVGEARSQATRAFGRLERGLDGYSIRRT